MSYRGFDRGTVQVECSSCQRSCDKWITPRLNSRGASTYDDSSSFVYKAGDEFKPVPNFDMDVYAKPQCSSCQSEGYYLHGVLKVVDGKFSLEKTPEVHPTALDFARTLTNAPVHPHGIPMALANWEGAARDAERAQEAS